MVDFPWKLDQSEPDWCSRSGQRRGAENARCSRYSSWSSVHPPDPLSACSKCDRIDGSEARKGDVSVNDVNLLHARKSRAQIAGMIENHIRSHDLKHQKTPRPGPARLQHTRLALLRAAAPGLLQHGLLLLLLSPLTVHHVQDDPPLLLGEVAQVRHVRQHRGRPASGPERSGHLHGHLLEKQNNTDRLNPGQPTNVHLKRRYTRLKLAS
ncbi:hypothetical protein MHYP_G00287030 [Metynnis hypsauchen]